MKAFLRGSLRSLRTSWSIGGFGAVAEFHPTPGTAVDGLTAVSDLGAIRIEAKENIALVAYEMLSAMPDSWHHGVLMCVPELSGRPVAKEVSELGIDERAVREEDRRGVLFDLGLGYSSFRFCVRLFDPAQIRCLRQYVGTSLLHPDCVLFRELQLWSPQRVVVSSCARIEVYQPIASRGERTPEGPHTHLIPKLLRPSRTHSTYMPVPDGFQVGLVAYPPSPIRDEHGLAKPFDVEQHRYFQDVLEAYGDPLYLAAKKSARRHFRTSANGAAVARTRLERNAWRITERQMAYEIRGQGRN